MSSKTSTGGSHDSRTSSRLRSGIALAFAFVPLSAGAQGTVFFHLASPQSNALVTPGQEVRWSIAVDVSQADNAGLALVSCDLLQSASNPERFDIPPADAEAIPPVMCLFSRPDGISNPGEGGLSTGYVGLQRGEPGARDLVQIGGAQNTLGVPGSVMGFNTRVIGGVGQAGPQVVTEGSFFAPSTFGVYTFTLENPLATTLVSIEDAPQPSPVRAANVFVLQDEFQFTVSAVEVCDNNVDDDGDTLVDCNDPDCATPGGAGGAGIAPNCLQPMFHRGDANADGTMNITDGVFTLNFLFLGGSRPPCLEAANANDGVAINITSGVYIFNFLFLGGPEPPAPGPVDMPCGPDPVGSPSNLGCQTYSRC